MDSRARVQAIIAELQAREQFLATAESCTGGLIAHQITDVSGASAVFAGGIVAYRNDLKMALLRVPEAVLAAHGAVSAETARAMVLGIRAATGTAWGVAVTGIAGPGGGTAAKPVGLVYIATAGPGGARVTRNQFGGERSAIKNQTADAALTQLWEHLKT